MATTTTNYGFDIPQSTDLVKDGATAIATLGQDIDTAMNTALGTKKAGMVLLNTTSFSAVSSISLPAATFSSTYQNYHILFQCDTTLACTFTSRLRVGGADNTASVYDFHADYLDTVFNNSSSNTSQTSWTLGATSASATNNFAFNMNLYNPFAAKYTNGQLIGNMSNRRIPITGFYHDTATSFDSLTIIASAGTITGRVCVYGYNL